MNMVTSWMKLMILMMMGSSLRKHMMDISVRPRFKNKSSYQVRMIQNCGKFESRRVMKELLLWLL